MGAPADATTTTTTPTTSMTSPSSSSPKTCFVTIGATASFSALIKAVFSASFLSALHKQGYTDLCVQYGQDGRGLYDTYYRDVLDKAEVEATALKITGFDLDTAGLGPYMRQAKGGGTDAQEGVVISHAGSGTILDALRVSVPLIVVPNSDLLDNHQVELAEALAEQEYVVHGKLDSLPQALKAAEELRKKQQSWPPPNAGVQRGVKGLKGVLDEEMGFLD